MVESSTLLLRVSLFWINSSDNSRALLMVRPLSIVEGWVALIVACMPAFAQFPRTHVSGSLFLRSFRDRLRSMRPCNENSTSVKIFDDSSSSRKSQTHDSRPRWWLIFTRGQSPSTSQSGGKAVRIQPRSSDLSYVFDEFDQSTSINSFQPETVIPSPAGEGFSCRMPTEPGITVTKAYGFDTANHCHPHSQAWYPALGFTGGPHLKTTNVSQAIQIGSKPIPKQKKQESAHS